MRYTDAQMVIASQIAYMDFDPAAIASGNYTLRELLEMNRQGADETVVQEIDALLNKIESYPGCERCLDWVIRDVRDNEHSTGMYACLIDTQDGNALVAYRGSESDTTEQVVKDWALADFGLINNPLTIQQSDAQDYLRTIYEKYGNQYENFSLTGHSLGGNLAEHAAITAPDGMRGKIDRCVNLDGPGFSQEYLLAHQNDLKKSSKCIDHYQWSIIGTLLNPVPDGNYRTVEADTPDKGSSGLDVLSSYLWRHDTANVNFDDDGSLLNGEKDPLATAGGPFSKSVDTAVFFGTGLISFVMGTVINGMDILSDAIDKLKEWWSSLTESRLADAEFAVNTYQVRSLLEQIQDIGTSISRIGEETAGVKNALAFHSVSASYLKVKLWEISNSIGNNAVKIQSCRTSGSECMRSYEAYETRVAGCYR